MVSECAPSRRVLATSPSLASWPRGAGKECPAPPGLAAAQMKAWLKGHAAPLALAGPTGDLKNDLLRRCLGC